jgi:tetratricopeptide (TPR) repeat protein
MKWIGNQRPPTSRVAIAATFAMITLATFSVAGCSHKSVDDELAAGDLAMQNTKLADAEADYQRAVALAPNDPRPHLALGNLYVFEQKPSQAEAEYTKVIELNPRHAAAHAALGNVFAGHSQAGLAEEQYRAAVAIESANPAYRINLASFLLKQGKLGEAEAHLRTALGLDGKNPRAHLALAKVLSAEPGRGAEAEAEFERVRTLNPSLLPGAAPEPPAGAPEPPAGVPSPAAMPSPPAPPMTSAAPPPAPARPSKLRELNRKFLLTHDSPVYQAPQESAGVVAQVHRGKYVRVTGITGKWLRVQLKNGTVGFVPVTAAE